ncbi:MAG: Asp-tRNA(Asn)/Glu-tRNA(Gln) amidotransferase subunit GatA [Myxococcales bacterium]|nr:Asp-tRNA(Asn)/Glu-tRNA(Gln) amidotransferase subunit GatA [Myxococcales bacterium]
MSDDLLFESALSLRERVVSKQISASELTGLFLDRIAKTDATYRAFLLVDRDSALAQARAIDGAIVRGDDVGPLAGVPVAIKDQIVTRGLRTTCASRMLEGFVPPYDATVVDRLRRAGAIIIGKTNQDEFAMGSSTENSAYGPTRNPWDPNRVPGGSSGGSAVAVALRQVPLALGTDTGGSIRQPASLCGVVGLKPTYGRVSRFGAVAFASSLDQIGPFANTVPDTAAIMNVIAGHDPNDSTCVPAAVPDYLSGLDGGIAGIKVGVPREYFVPGMTAGVESAIQAGIDRLRAAGAELVEISLPHTDYCVATYYIIATAEASSNLARYDGVRYGYRAKEPKDLYDMYSRSRDEGFGSEVKRRIMLGTYVLSSGYYDAYYRKAQQVRTLIRQDFDAAFQKVDVIACPVSPVTAFKLGEMVEDPLQMYLMDILTISCNLAGLPGISVPCGFSDNLPVGLQLLAKPLGETVLLRTARAHEMAYPDSARRAG